MTGALFNTLIMEGLHGKTSLLQVTLVMPQIIQVHTPTSMKIHIPFGIAARPLQIHGGKKKTLTLVFYMVKMM